MEIIKKILQYILIIILALFVVALVVINIMSRTVLNSAYVILKLEEQDYFSQIYEDAMSSFENYIPQSGLEETVLEGIISKEKIQDDTEVILGNLYDGINASVDTTEIADKLMENIIAEVGEEIVNENSESIEKLIDNICDAYKDAITHTEYEDSINTYYTKISEAINVGKIVISIGVLIDIIIIVVLNKNSIYKFLNSIGITFMISGLIFIVVNKFIYLNIKIDSLTVFNDAISNLLRSVLNDMLSKIMIYGCILTAIGLVATVIFGMLDARKKQD